MHKSIISVSPGEKWFHGKLEFMLSQRGKPLLVHDGHTFGIQYIRKDKKYWQCNLSRKYNCKARVTTTDTGEIIVTNNEHCHTEIRQHLRKDYQRTKLLNAMKGFNNSNHQHHHHHHQAHQQQHHHHHNQQPQQQQQHHHHSNQHIVNNFSALNLQQQFDISLLQHFSRNFKSNLINNNSNIHDVNFNNNNNNDTNNKEDDNSLNNEDRVKNEKLQQYREDDLISSPKSIDVHNHDDDDDDDDVDHDEENENGNTWQRKNIGKSSSAASFRE